ncbi:uncharacterized protein TRAVEDRAFT_55066 [Trametes versicolor FP-101664 SS1]|uniref:uncharacterized protein n=1 Tax=Trametes versicolor (strain FP-101664) TaxID=717944 RepID=UPI0004622324|nr:uncharacterized protein TRAVEDRAFT_55066 [Trametes versicolor FP-101664 SS1]EIW64009.1 hypothetical protein TRAVEDRAFT_55066 [Trametes versicolor FP-101664 SS1]
MSSREPMWYCHECHAEMRPLMVPDPHCASCNGTFVEKIENPADDPRGFRVADGGQWDNGALPGDMDAFLTGLRRILRPPQPPTASASSNSRSRSPTARRSSSDSYRQAGSSDTRTTGRTSPFTLRIERTNAPGGRTRTFVLGGQPTAAGDELPRLSQFAPPRNLDGTAQDRPNITGPMLAQYLLALMGPGRGGDPFSDMLGGMFGPAGMPPGGAESGRWGDYVFNQEALDQIISQIMENSNAHQPVPATEDALEKLPREVLEEGSPLLEKDCAVCKDQFSLQSEDPDELVVVTLPCKHPFHETCIMPWLKNSGTCPVCRYQLVPQPDPHSGPGAPQAGSSGPSTSSSSRSGSGDNSGAGAGPAGSGLLQNVFNFFSNHAQQGTSTSGPSPSSTQSGTASAAPPSASAAPSAGSSGSSGSRSTPPSRRNTDDHLDLPGGWGDEID